MSRPIEVDAAYDGTLTYLIDFEPSDLPAVRTNDILRAWSFAHDAAHRAAAGVERAFRFRRSDGGWVVFALRDRDAICWAGAVDRTLGMETSYGLAVCLRLLALIDLLARAPWAHAMIDLACDARLNPALVRLAAETRLTDEAGFDERKFEHVLQTKFASSLQDGAPRP